MEKDEGMVLLLQLLKRNGNIEFLHKQGYQYSQIAQLINLVLKRNLAYYSDTGLSLTDEGEKTLSIYNKHLNRKNSEALISPQTEYITNKASKYDIYLPQNTKKLR